jgi:hypothetical protein
MELGIAVPPLVAAYTLSAAVVLNKLEPAFAYSHLFCAVNLRKRALGVKEHDDGQRKCELEAKERDELKRFSKFANTKKLRSELQRPQQQQRALKQSVSHVITLGLKDIQTRLLQAYAGPQPGRRPATAPNHQNKSHAAARSVLPATQQRCPDHGRAS